MLHFFRGRRSYLLFLLLSLALLSRKLGLSGFWEGVRRSFLNTAGSFQRLLSGTERRASSFLELLREKRELLEERERLEREIARLRAENFLLRKQLELFRLGESISAGGKVLLARTSGLFPSQKYLFITIDRGRKDGLVPDLPVLDCRGNVVGRTVEPVAERTSRVMLITNPMSAVGAKVGGIVGVLKGRGGRLCFVDYIYAIHAPEKGAEVFTSGYDGIFPEGLPLGRVSRVSAGEDLFAEVLVKPFFDFKSIEYVVVLKR